MSDFKKIIALSSLEKVFPDMVPGEPFQQFSMLKNEKYSFQVAFQAKKGSVLQFQIESELAASIQAFYVKLMPCALAAPVLSDNYFITKKPGDFPDLLEPIADSAVTALYDGYQAIWFEIKSEQPLPAGSYPLTVRFTDEGAQVGSVQLRAEVIDACLPEQSLIYTNWFHTDCIMSHYHVDAFSEAYWELTERFLKRAGAYGMNCVLTPLFTPPLDTEVGGERPTVQLVDVRQLSGNTYEFGFDKVDQWIAMCKRCNVRYYEMSHLFTQWGAKHAPKIIAQVDGVPKQIFGWKTKAAGKEYRAFIAQFAKAFIAYIDQKGIRSRCLFHVSDEPSKRMLRQYKKASQIVHENFTGFQVIDALSDYKIYKKGLIETPIPANDHVGPFIGKVKDLWTYYCCCQCTKNVSNRFFAMPSQRNRVLGYQLYKFDVKGFLHWGFNFWYAQYSKRVIDPFQETDAGKAFSSGDSFVVYPGENGEPLDSLRLHVFFDALQDMRALQLLESRLGKAATIRLLEEGIETPITFNDYPHDAAWQLAARERVNREIQKTNP